MKKGDVAIYHSPFGDQRVTISSVIDDCVICKYPGGDIMAVPLRRVDLVPVEKDVVPPALSGSG